MATVSSSVPQEPLDPWDQPIASSSSRSRRAPVQVAAVVPDDWDDDEDDEPQNEEDNQRIWDDANTRTANPMPSLVISPTAASGRSVISPPPGAFEQKMRILKRPSASGSKSSTPPPSTSSESLKDREARYQAARERIFGDDGNSSSQERKEKGSSEPQNGLSVVVLRNPRGPSNDSAEGAADGSPRGFNRHRTKPPLAPQDIRSA